jgi:hypothetical protein
MLKKFTFVERKVLVQEAVMFVKKMACGQFCAGFRY